MPMACKAENELIATLIWSKKEYSLSEFITEYPLPQVVRVVDGYHSENEDSCVGAHQVLALHSIHTTPKVVGNNCFGKPVAIPLGCPTKAVVHPLKCKNCTVGDLKSVYRKIEFVIVESSDMDVGSHDRGDQSIHVDDLLKITKIDKKRKMVDFQNVDTGQLVSLGYAFPASFTPVLDSRRYSIAEIKKIYGFPARVRFLNEGREVGIRRGKRSTVGRYGSTNTAVSSLGEIVLVKEAIETTVISTNVGGESEKFCIGLPKELPINFAVAEGFLKGGGNYEEVVTTLHTKFKVTSLGDFDQLNVCQHLNAVRKFNFLNIQNEPVVPPRPLPSSRRQFPKSSTNSTGKEVLPVTSFDADGSYDDVESSEHPEYAYVEFSDEKPPQSSPASHEENGQKDRAPNIPKRKISTSTKHEKSNPTSSFGDDLRCLLHDQEEDMYKRISQIPVDLSELTVDDVGEVLKCLHMDAYVGTFEEEMIDGPMLKDLDLQTLESLNVTLFHGKKLTKFIDGWRPRKGQPK